MTKLIRAAQMVGQTYNDLTVIAADGIAPKKARVQCKCGKEFFANAYQVRTGHTKSCGCRNNRPQAKDRIGQKHGMLTILRRTDRKKDVEYICRCDCGNETVATWRNMRSGNTKSCGCLKHDVGGIDHYNAIPFEEVKQRFAAYAPQITFPFLDTEWKGGSHSLITAICKDHGKFVFDGRSSNCFSILKGTAICTACALQKRADSNGFGNSKGEQEIRAYVKHLGLKVERGLLPKAKTWLFDAVIPDRRIVIEYNGVYWHSFPRAKRGQHVHKRKFAEANGYRMITIWEDQWVYERERVERYLSRALLGTDKRVGARKTHVRQIDNDVAGEFHTAWHLQGAHPTTATQHIGLTHKGQLVALASFDRKGVLHRYTTGDTAVTGGLHRILKASGFDTVVTYCNRDHFTGKVYAASGFEKTGHTMQLTYVVNKQRVRRERFMKKNLIDIFGPENVDLTKTEHEICADNGVYAAYNSGIDRWVWHRP